MDLFYPELAVQLGSYTLNRGICVTACSSKDSYFDWAKVRFTRDFPEKITLSKLDTAVVYLGYNGQYNPVFKGYATTDFALSDNLNEIVLKDAALKLESTYINNTFVYCSPSEVVTYCCQQSGIDKVVLPPQQYLAKTYYPVFNLTALKAIQGINSHYNINAKFYLQDDTFYWNTTPPQKEMYHFEYQKNIISLVKEGGLWVLTTVSVPFVKHSQKIMITHPLLSGEHEISKVIFTSNESGFIRAKLYFKG